MADNWETSVLGFLAWVWVIWLIAFRVLNWASSRRFPTPIYGGPDLYRLKGPQARQNLRAVR